MTKRLWAVVFLGLTSGAIALELWASFDNDENTTPWTDYIVEYVPPEIAAFAVGGLATWLAVHFGLRYWRRSKERP